MAAVVHRLRQRHAHHARPRRCAQSSRVSCTISMMVRTPRPPRRRARRTRRRTRLRDEALERLPSLSLSRWKPQRVDRAVGAEARHQEAGEPARRLRQHQEGVAHRRRHEPFVAGDRRSHRPPAARGVVLARTSVPPCFSVMPMPSVMPDLLPPGPETLGRSCAGHDLRHQPRQAAPARPQAPPTRRASW